MSASLRGITSKDEGDFHFRIVFIRLEQKGNWNRLKKYVKIKTFFELKWLLNALRYQGLISTGKLIRHHQYADLEYLTRQVDGYKKNPENHLQ